jgi:alpha-ketoglutaric semialdehyde dehydrogenase
MERLMSKNQPLDIGGEAWSPASAVSPRHPVVSPADVSDTVALVQSIAPRDVDNTVKLARRGFAEWSQAPVQQRSDVLAKASVELSQRALEVATILAREEGKTLPEALGEVRRAAAIFAFFSAESVRVHGQCGSSVRANVDVSINREPLGVVGLIAPWNFPAAIPAWKLAPALAFGNSVVLKPSELAPVTAWMLCDILYRAGLPDGVLTLLLGQGDVGAALVQAPDIDAISFTGSVASGALVAAKSAKRGIRYQLEMGGKNPLLVLGDCDLDLAVECAIDGAFYASGQRCTASSRIIVEDRVYDQFLRRFVERTEDLCVGHSLDPDVAIGPVIDRRHLERHLSYVRLGQEEGARLACGGVALSRDHDGHYFAPTIFADALNGMRICQEEIFGPVAAVIRAKDYDEAVAFANDTQFGLTAGIVTNDARRARHFKRNAKAGMVMVNLPTAGIDYHVPFGGTKASSFGPREQGGAALEFYTTTKTIYERYA